jgi:phosphocarrier protein FPr
VLQLIDRVCHAARGRVEVAVCGESASDDAAVPLLLGLGVRELSVGPHDVPRVKARVRELDLAHCEVTAKASLVLDSAADVRELVAAKLGPTPHA